MAEIWTEEATGGMIAIHTPYNSLFISALKKKVGGRKWDDGLKAWLVPEDAIEVVRELMYDHFGMTDEYIPPLIKCELEALQDITADKGDVILMGKTLCHAIGRDSGGRVGEDVYYKVGEPKSGGSVKKWKSVVPKGSEIILSNVSEMMYDRYMTEPAYGTKVKIRKVEEE